MKVYGFLVSLIFFASCSQNNVTIKGSLNSIPDDETIILELVSTNGQVVADSTKTKKGSFKFNVKLIEGQPAIYNIRYKEQIIPLVVSPGDRIRLNALGNINQTYEVQGSTESALMREITKIMNNGASSLDSLTNIYSKLTSADDSLRNKLAGQYAKQYYKIKRDQIGFIVTNPSSLAALYALYQRLPNDEVLFNGENDVVYFRLVADSLGAVHPNSPYLQLLQKEIASSSAGNNIAQLMEKAQQNAVLSYPEIELSDMYGKKVKLSSQHGKVVLLEFWSAASQQSRMSNIELKEVYDQFSKDGFEVYQVSLDESKPLWVTTVQDQKLPWISVSDFRGANSPIARTYNITSVPTNFLIDRSGNIVAKNVSRGDLLARVKQLL